MGCAVIVTPQGIEDLGGIVRHIAADAPERARDFGQRLLTKALSVGTFPAMGRVVPETTDPTVREVLMGDYRILYEIYPDRGVVYILRFWHAARGEPDLKKIALE